MGFHVYDERGFDLFGMGLGLANMKLQLSEGGQHDTLVKRGASAVSKVSLQRYLNFHSWGIEVYEE